MKRKPVLGLKVNYTGHGFGHERLWDASLVRLASRRRAYAAAFAAGLAILVLGVMLVRQVDRPAAPDRPVQFTPNTAYPAGHVSLPTAPGTLGLLLDKAALEEQMAVAKSALNRIIEGKLDQQTHDALRQFPEYGGCRSCVEDCEQSLKGANEVQLRECRRNCLSTCSDRARRLLHGDL